MIISIECISLIPNRFQTKKVSIVKYFLILSLTLLISACSSSPDNLGEQAAAQSKAYEQISKQYEKGEDIVKDGEKETSKGRKLIEEGRKNIQKGDALLLNGNFQIQQSRKNYAATTGEAAPSLVPTDIKAESKALKTVIEDWQDGVDDVKKGNKLIKNGNEKIRKGEAKIRAGNKKIDHGKDMIRRAETKYKNRKSFL